MAAYFPPGTNNATEIYVDAGGSVEISCNAEGNPPPAITWSKVGKITKNIDSRSLSKLIKMTKASNGSVADYQMFTRK